MTNSPKAYIFDMDGTLVDSVCALEVGVKNYLNSKKISYPENIVEIITPLGYRGAAEYIQSLGLDMSVEDIEKMMKDSMAYEYENTIPLKPHAKDVIKKLHEEGKPLCVLTASPHFLTDPCLKRVGVDSFFKFIWSTDDFGLKKSDEQIYHEVAKALGIAIDECIFVDDNLINIQTAKRTGIGTVAIFDEANAVSTEMLKQTADKYIYSFEEF